MSGGGLPRMRQRKAPSHFLARWPNTLGVAMLIGFLCLGHLLDDNMGNVNEVDILPFARQYADPTWIPADWYLNQSPGYRLPFLTTFAWMIPTLGFLPASIAGRIICYGMVAGALCLIGRRLGLGRLALLSATGLFLYTWPRQGMVAHEWIVGGFEPKSVAYGTLLLAVASMLSGHYRWTGLMLGLTLTFHVLVGGWAFLVFFMWTLVKFGCRSVNVRELMPVLGFFVLGGLFSVGPLLHELSEPPGLGHINAAYVYVFLRAPHHLNPLSWNPALWIRPAVYGLLFALCVILLRRVSIERRKEDSFAARMDLARFTLLSLVPFVGGLALAPLDQEGRFLHFYPFRLGDVMLPLGTCLLLCCVLEELKGATWRRWLARICLVFLGIVTAVQIGRLCVQISGLLHFPSEAQGANPEWMDLCGWIRDHTPRDAIFVTSPSEFENFSWLAERATIAKFKLVPPDRDGVLEWYRRVGDLAGGNPWPRALRTEDPRKAVREALSAGYHRFSTSAAQSLMGKYQADYWVARADHHLALPVAYGNSRYVLYGKLDGAGTAVQLSRQDP
jgi:hypothetical protein